MLDLSVVVVSWNVRDLLRACLRSVDDEVGNLERQAWRAELDAQADEGALLHGIRDAPAAYEVEEAPRAEVIVVDNASADGSADMVAREFPRARLIANRHNRGFGAANNQALELCSGRWVLFLNPDAELQPGALRRLLGFADARPRVGCVGPRLLNADGSTQSSRRSFPGVATAFVESTMLQRYLGGLAAVRRFYRDRLPDDRAQQVDWLVGACLMVRRSALAEAGGFDERFFMYAEEMDLCWRLRRAGCEVWFVPDAEVVHHEGASSRQDLFRRNVNFHESRYRFFRKHHGPAPALALRWFVFGTFAAQLLEEAAKWLLQPAKRPMRRERMRLHGRMVRWYLSGS